MEANCGATKRATHLVLRSKRAPTPLILTA